jgi:hypothetical protein
MTRPRPLGNPARFRRLLVRRAPAAAVADRPSKKSPAEQLLMFAQIITPFFIFCGVTKLVIFYRYFGIDVIDYLELSEILTSFLDDIVIFFLMGLMLAYAVMSLSPDDSATGKSSATAVTAERDLLPFRVPRQFYYTLVVAFGQSVAVLVIQSDRTVVFEMASWVVPLMLPLLALELAALLLRKPRKPRVMRNVLDYLNEFPAMRPRRVRIFTASVIVLGFVVSMVPVGVIEHFRVVERAKYFRDRFELENATILTTPRFFFVGKTNKYFFFHNLDSATSTILPADKVRRVVTAIPYDSTAPKR